MIYSLIDSAIPKLPVNLLDHIATGADGRVYNIGNKKVAKVSCILGSEKEVDYRARMFEKTLAHIIETYPGEYVRVHEYGKLDSGSIDNKSYSVYYTIMDKLQDLEPFDKLALKLCLDFDYEYLEDKVVLNHLYNAMGIIRIPSGIISRALFFMHMFLNSSIDHNDIHIANIMKDSFGSFKLIDLDRAVIK